MHHHEHNHTHEHSHTHAHEHSHAHAHEHEHEHEHTHEQAHNHAHTDGQPHQHDDLLKSKAEAAAFLQYTLQHNAHHEEELSGLVHSLQHLQHENEAGEIAACIEELTKVNARLEAVLAALK